ncbi:MAG: hypothetical protein ACOZEN_08535 [Thermodesulfobacteriota bacterium]
MANTPEDIIELTDIIEHGPGAKQAEAAEGGVDLSFERELEDLFADSPDDKPASGADDLPGLDSLHLPEEDSKAEGEGIDLDGLDALLADAGKSEPDGMDLPELTDDFFEQAQAAGAAPEPAGHDDISFDAAMAATSAAAAGVAAAAVLAPVQEEVSGHALEALTARLDLLEEKLTGMGDTLSSAFKSMLDEALASFKAELPAADAQAPSPAIDELRQSLEEKIESLRAGLPGAVDESALAASVKEMVLSELPAPPAGFDSEAVEALVDGKLEAFRAGLPEPAGAAAPVDESALAASVKEMVLSELPAPSAGLDSEAVEALVDGKLEAFKAALPGPAAPDLSGLASIGALDALRAEILGEIQKAVPAAAARIIREEIQALVQEMD